MPKNFRDFIQKLEESTNKFNFESGKDLETDSNNVRLAKKKLIELAKDKDQYNKIKEGSKTSGGKSIKQKGLTDKKIKNYLLSIGIMSRIAAVNKKRQTLVSGSPVSQKEAIKLLQSLEIEDLKTGQKSMNTVVRTGNGFLNKMTDLSKKEIKQPEKTTGKKEVSSKEVKDQFNEKPSEKPKELEEPSEEPEDKEEKSEPEIKYTDRAKGKTPNEIAKEIEAMQDEAKAFFDKMEKPGIAKEKLRAIDWARQYMGRNVDKNINAARKWNNKFKYFPEKSLNKARKFYNNAKTTIAIAKNNAERRQLKGKVARGFAKIKEIGAAVKKTAQKVYDDPKIKEIGDTIHKVKAGLTDALKGKIEQLIDYAEKKNKSADFISNSKLVGTFLGDSEMKKFIDTENKGILDRAIKAREIAVQKAKEGSEAKAKEKLRAKAIKNASKIKPAGITSPEEEKAKATVKEKVKAKMNPGYKKPEEKEKAI